MTIHVSWEGISIHLYLIAMATVWIHWVAIDGLVQDCSNSSELAMTLLQSYMKPSIATQWIHTVFYMSLKIGRDNGLVPSDSKPLSHPIFTHMQWDTKIHNELAHWQSNEVISLVYKIIVSSLCPFLHNNFIIIMIGQISPAMHWRDF